MIQTGQAARRKWGPTPPSKFAYYSKPLQEGVYPISLPFSIAASTSLPIMLYSVPGRSGGEIQESRAVARLATDCPRYVIEMVARSTRVNQL
jgi:4-hydroxy-tetrahydrodipicolinate synthase